MFVFIVIIGGFTQVFLWEGVFVCDYSPWRTMNECEFYSVSRIQSLKTQICLSIIWNCSTRSICYFWSFTSFCLLLEKLEKLICRSSHQRHSVKKIFLKISQNSKDNTFGVSLSITLHALGLIGHLRWLLLTIEVFINILDIEIKFGINLVLE